MSARIALLLCLSPALAAAKPAPPPDSEQIVDAPQPCSAGDWKRVAACLAYDNHVGVLYESLDVKVVSLAPKNSNAKTYSVIAYALRESRWKRLRLGMWVDKPTSIVTVTPFPIDMKRGVRVDVATMGAALGISGGVLRRKMSVVCEPNGWTCESVMSACDIYVRGRLKWTFHGGITWDASRGFRVRGDARRAGSTCQPRTPLLDEEA